MEEAGAGSSSPKSRGGKYLELPAEPIIASRWIDELN